MTTPLTPKRTLVAAAAGAAILALLARPSFWLYLYVLRELLVGAELVGLMDPSGDLGGQILGHNFQRHPEWVHWVVGAIAAEAGFGPALLLAVFLGRRMRGSDRATWCGRCGSELRNLTELRCPACTGEFSAEGRPSRWYHARRLVVALVLLGAVHVYIDRAHRWTIAGWILERGQAAGCQVIQLGRIVSGPNGPFYGDGLKPAMWNFAYRHGPWTCAAAGGYLAAAAGYLVCASPRLLGRSRAFGYRGPTRCGNCGYSLAGLREPKCPECGRMI